MRYNDSLLMLILIGGLVLPACGSPSRGDDDDASGDDDDSAANDDDDDSVADDDDVVGDDDDVLGDDDDVVGDDDDDDDSVPEYSEGDSVITGSWLIRYVDANGGDYCQQAYQFQGEAEFSPFAVGGSCTICTGEMVVLMVNEVSTNHPDVTIPCDDSTHFSTSENLGYYLTDPNSGFGDLIGNQAFIDRETAFQNSILTSQQNPVDLDGDGDIDGSPEDIHQQLQTNGGKLTHIGYVEAPESGSYFGMVGLHTVAVSPPGAPDYLPMWWYGTGAGADVVMGGDYILGSFWQINSNDPAAEYASVQFSGAVQAVFTPPAGG